MRSKKNRTKGKIQLSRYFQELKLGDRVSIVREPSVGAGFPDRLQGKTGIVKGKRGKAYIIELRDYIYNKKFIVEPIHLKKIN